MSNLDALNSKLNQTILKPTDDDGLRVIVKQNHFIAGCIRQRTFYNVQRSPKNLFNLFGGGLGLNAEILSIIFPHFNVNRIRIPYQDKILETTPDKWRKLGIVSPFCNSKVDKQIILALSDINMDDADQYSDESIVTPKTQFNLFEVANG